MHILQVMRFGQYTNNSATEHLRWQLVNNRKPAHNKAHDRAYDNSRTMEYTMEKGTHTMEIGTRV